MLSILVTCGLFKVVIASMNGANNNMNSGMAYTVSNPASGHAGESRQFASSDYFELDAPVMKMRYSEVLWRTLPAVHLPAEIVSRYSQSSMAVTGFEVDLLRRNNSTGELESVPAYQNYNHHYGVMMYSSSVRMKVDENGQATGPDVGHGKMLEFELLEHVKAPPANARLAQSFIHGNGQEHRGVFHGAPSGYAQPIFAPASFVVTPMQISTNDGTGRKGAGGLLPKIKQQTGATPANPKAQYSPLLECPCTTRMRINGPAGTINGQFMNGDCRAEPLSDLLATNNPTCNASTYVGGLACCGDGDFLLDADQEVPAFVDEVFFRFRFYHEDYDPSKHQDLDHVEWAANGCDSGCGGNCPNNCKHIEFDVQKGAGSHIGPDVQVFQSTFAAGDMLAASCAPTNGQCFDGSKVDPAKGFKLLMAATHCHAPNCIRQELINKDSGEILCSGTTVLGQTEASKDEAGYLFTPPCLWGAPADGLLPPPVLLKNTTMQMVTYFNSTFFHPGQMAIWQMKAAVVR